MAGAIWSDLALCTYLLGDFCVEVAPCFRKDFDKVYSEVKRDYII